MTEDIHVQTLMVTLNKISVICRHRGNDKGLKAKNLLLVQEQVQAGKEPRAYLSAYVTLTVTVKVNCPGWIGTAAASDAAPPPLPSKTGYGALS